MNMVVVQKAGKKKKRSIFLRIVLLLAAIYIVFVLVQLQSQIKESKNKLATLDSQMATANAALLTQRDKVDNYEQYLEEKAREQGYARPDESIISVVPKNE